MRPNTVRTCLALAALLAAATPALAGPDLLITAPPVVPNGAGPPIDPDANYGQWFQNLNGSLTNRTYEFYDNRLGNGGGAAGTGAVSGVLNQVFTDPNGNVTGFTINASITNDLATISGPWLPGTNDHGEALRSDSSYVGTLYATKMSIEFADDGTGTFNPAIAPNRPYPTPLQIFAVGYDEKAWFSYTTSGAFQVPTYDFGDIALGQTATRTLAFGLYTPVAQALFYNAIYGTPTPSSSDLRQDLFSNRTTDLKIGNFLDQLTPDTGAAYPVPPLLSGNVSVFNAVPEPGSLALLGLGAAGLLGHFRKRRSGRGGR
jgi:hypothetical protein